MNRSIKGLFVAAVAVVGFTFMGTQNAMAQQNSANASATATANIVSPIAVTKDTDLNFGDVIPSASSGTVTVDESTQARTNGGGVTLGNGTAVTRATFTVTGNSGSTYSITVPASVNLTGAGSPMTATLVGSKATGTLTGGTDGFGVGGTLTVGASQANGTYSGSFQVTVAYN